MPNDNIVLLTNDNSSALGRETKAIIQRVYEYIASASRPVSARELVTAMSDCSRSAITFALTRLVREGDLKRVGRGRYIGSGEDDPTVQDPEDDEYLFTIFERIRPVLSFAELAFLYELAESARRLIPEAFRAARNRSRRRDPDPSP
jgi:predicted transcriptional regulator of viral defense system